MLQVIVNTFSNFTAFSGGTIDITPIGTLRDSDTFSIQPDSIATNSSYTYLLKVPKSLGRISKAEVNLRNDGSVVNPLGDASYQAWEIISELQFNYMSNRKRE